jgi:hypothetical protein
MFFPSIAGGGATVWYDPAWLYRQEIALGEVSSITDYVMYVEILSHAGLQAHALDNGDDILFTDSDATTKLPHEIERYDWSHGRLFAWVKVPSISTGKRLYMYYGNAAASNQQDVANVWSSSYLTVHHLNDSLPQDSTANNVDAVSKTSVQAYPYRRQISSHVPFAGNQAFSGVLRNKDLSILTGDGGLDSNSTWAYSIDLVSTSDDWTGFARSYNLDTMAVGTKTQVKAIDAGLSFVGSSVVIKLSSTFYLMFYTGWAPGERDIRAAKASAPNGTFTRINSFLVQGSETWEGLAIEIDPGFGIAQAQYTDGSDQCIDYWILYSDQSADSVHDNGWMRVKVNITQETVTFVEKYVGNPLTALRVTSGANTQSRVGGTDPTTLIGNKYAFYELAKPSGSNQIWRALSDDPLFATVDQLEFIHDMTRPEGGSFNVQEKMSYYERGKQLYIMYDGSASGANDWALMVRKFEQDFLGGFHTFTQASSQLITLGSSAIGTRMNSKSRVAVLAWVRIRSINSAQFGNCILNVVINGTSSGVFLQVNGVNSQLTLGARSQTGETYREATVSGALPLNQWMLVGGILDYAGKTITLIKDGVLGTPASVAFSANAYTQGTPSAADSIGNSAANTTLGFDGDIDELRVLDASSLTVNQTWVDAIVANHESPSSFYTLV